MSVNLVRASRNGRPASFSQQRQRLRRLTIAGVAMIGFLLTILQETAAQEMTSPAAFTLSRGARAFEKPLLSDSFDALASAPEPSSAAEWNRLAEECMTRGRESGDLRWYLEARKALHKASEYGTTNPVTLRNTAWMFTIFHRYDDAVECARLALAEAPSDVLSYGILYDAFLEMGSYEEAREAVDKMLDLRPGLSSYSRAAHLLWMDGETTGALTLMQDAVEAGAPTWEASAWARTQLAEMLFKTGDLAGSERECRLALRFFPEHASALAGLGRVAAAQGRYEEAVDFYERAAASRKQIPHMVELGALYRKTTQHAKAEELYKSIEYTVDERQRQGFAGDELSLAMLYADESRNLDTALTLARIEVEGHETVQAYQALTWVLYRQGKYQEAESILPQALRMGTRDPLLLYHAGKVYEAGGDTVRMQQSLEAALQMNPQFHIQFADDARASLTRLSGTGE